MMATARLCLLRSAELQACIEARDLDGLIARIPNEQVAAEVRNGILSVQSALEDYGVVLDPEAFQVDFTQTEKLRSGRNS